MAAGTLIIRADASLAIGTGHTMRCLALAQAWQDAGGDVVFAMAQSTPSVEDQLRSEHMGVFHVAAADDSRRAAEQVVELARGRHAEWVVVDGPSFDASFVLGMKAAGLRVLQIDDFGNASDNPADIILNQNLGADESQYRSRKPYTRLLLGTSYALLRREFTSGRRGRREFPEVGRRLLVTLGGTDPKNLTLLVLQSLEMAEIPGLETTVVVGCLDRRLPDIKRAAACGSSNMRILVDPRNMPELMFSSDVAVIAAGVTLWELLYMGCAVLSYARNPIQAQVISDLERRGTVRNLGAAPESDGGRLNSTLREIAESKILREQMAGAGRRIVDGQGAARVLQALGT